MAKFSVECPKCGTMNLAKTGLFAKKQFPCARCGHTIVVNNMKRVARKCPYCGKISMIDAGLKGKYVCLNCNKKVEVSQAIKIKDVEINCPICKQKVSFPYEDGQKEATCPICQGTIDIEEIYERQRAIDESKEAIIEYNGDNETFVHKHEVENFKYGSVIIVNPNQEAMFIHDGVIAKTFTPGRYVLDKTAIRALGQEVDEGDTAFSTSIYFVNKTHQQGIHWAVPNVTVTDPEYNMQFKVSLSGQLGFKVVDSSLLLMDIIGTDSHLGNAAFLNGELLQESQVKTLDGFYRSILIQNVNSVLPSIITYNNLSLATINENYRILGEKIRASLNGEFEKIGLAVPDFSLESIFFPEIPENANYHKLVQMKNASIMEKKEVEREKEHSDLRAEADINRISNVADVETAHILAERRTQNTQDENEILHEAKELEKLKLKETERLMVERNDLDLATSTLREMGQANSDVTKLQGEAEASAIRATGVAEADVMKAKGYTEKDLMVHKEHLVIDEKLPELAAIMDEKEKELFEKEVIMASIKAGKSENNEDSDESGNWDCECGKTGLTGKFCPECGKGRPSVITSWDCACGKTGLTGKFCPECGKARP